MAASPSVDPSRCSTSLPPSNPRAAFPCHQASLPLPRSARSRLASSREERKAAVREVNPLSNGAAGSPCEESGDANQHAPPSVCIGSLTNSGNFFIRCESHRIESHGTGGGPWVQSHSPAEAWMAAATAGDSLLSMHPILLCCFLQLVPKLLQQMTRCISHSEGDLQVSHIHSRLPSIQCSITAKPGRDRKAYFPSTVGITNFVMHCDACVFGVAAGNPAKLHDVKLMMMANCC